MKTSIKNISKHMPVLLINALSFQCLQVNTYAHNPSHKLSIMYTENVNHIRNL